MRLAVWIDNGVIKAERRRGGGRERACDGDLDYPWAEVYEIYTDDDGTMTALVSETKYADMIDRIRRMTYELSK